MTDKAPSAAARLPSNLGNTPQPEEMVWIVLEDNDSIPPTGQFFGLNGRNWHLRAGEKTRVPIGIVNILDDAVESRPVRDGSQRVVGHRNRHRFPYRVLRDGAAA